MMKVLIIQQKMIGDVLTSSMMFKAIKEVYPQAELHYLINSHTFSVVQNNPYIDRVIFFTEKEANSTIALLKFARALRKENFEVVIDVYSKLSSNIITLFSGARTKISYYKYYTTSFYTLNIKRRLAPLTQRGLAVEHRLQLLEPLNIHNPTITPEIYLTKEEIQNGATFLEDHHIDLSQPLYMMAVLGSGANKTMPFEYMAEVIDTVIGTTGGQILFNYMPQQIKEAKAIYELCQPKNKPYIFFDVYGKDLRDFLAITYHCNALIGNEGGAINMAKALKVPTFAIFSPWIDTATWGNQKDNNHVTVHLKDFKPELYAGKSEKDTKKDALEFYKLFQPVYFMKKLKAFLN